MKSLAIASALLALAASATPAAAAPASQTPYAFGVDLAGAQTPDGASRIWADIRRQAARVCSPLHSADGMLTKAARACRAEVTENAVRAIDKPLVTALWREETPAQLARG